MEIEEKYIEDEKRALVLLQEVNDMLRISEKEWQEIARMLKIDKFLNRLNNENDENGLRLENEEENGR